MVEYYAHPIGESNTMAAEATDEQDQQIGIEMK